MRDWDMLAIRGWVSETDRLERRGRGQMREMWAGWTGTGSGDGAGWTGLRDGSDRSSSNLFNIVLIKQYNYTLYFNTDLHFCSELQFFDFYLTPIFLCLS